MQWITDWWKALTLQENLDQFEVVNHRLDETLANTTQQKEGF